MSEEYDILLKAAVEYDRSILPYFIRQAYPRNYFRSTATELLLQARICILNQCAEAATIIAGEALLRAIYDRILFHLPDIGDPTFYSSLVKGNKAFKNWRRDDSDSLYALRYALSDKVSYNQAIIILQEAKCYNSDMVSRMYDVKDLRNVATHDELPLIEEFDPDEPRSDVEFDPDEPRSDVEHRALLYYTANGVDVFSEVYRIHLTKRHEQTQPNIDSDSHRHGERKRHEVKPRYVDFDCRKYRLSLKELHARDRIAVIQFHLVLDILAAFSTGPTYDKVDDPLPPRTFLLTQGKGSGASPLRAEGDDSSTLVVCARGTGQYTTIRAAINDAQPGTRVEIRPGIYRECLILSKEVTLAGDGRPEDIIVETPEMACLIMQTDHATVEGLTLQATSSTHRRDFPAIDLQRGRLELKGCNIKSLTDKCIAIHGVEANPFLYKCAVENTMGSGIEIYEQGQGTLEACTISTKGGGGTGITVSNASATINYCRIEQSSPGLIATSQSVVTLKDSHISENYLGGVNVALGASVHMRACTVANNKGLGMLFSPNSEGTVDECVISDNTESGIVIEEGSSPTIRKSRIERNGSYGIDVQGGAGLIEDCDLIANGIGSYYISNTGNSLFVNNREQM